MCILLRGYDPADTSTPTHTYTGLLAVSQCARHPCPVLRSRHLRETGPSAVTAGAKGTGLTLWASLREATSHAIELLCDGQLQL